MPPQTIERRVERLEEQVTNLQQLPARIDGLAVEISQLRQDLGAKISALILSDDRILAQVRMLHEDVIARLALIQEGRRARRAKG